MTSAAQAALRRVIEKYAKSVRFCLICNYVSKIIPAIQSRCTKFRFAPLPENEIFGRMEHVIASEGITISEEGKKALLRVSEGDMRKVLNVLQVCGLYLLSMVLTFYTRHVRRPLVILMRDQSMNALESLCRKTLKE